MREGWEIKTIGDICFVGGGSTPRRTEKAFWENGTYPWFSIDDIRDQGRIITETKQKITKLAWSKMRVFPANSVLLCCTASVGEYALSTIPITSNQQFNGLTIKDHKQMLPMYLFYFCSTLKPVLQGLSGRATIDFVSSEKVRQIRIPFPSLPEQQRIVAILDREFAKIDALKANAEKSLQAAKDLYAEMLNTSLSSQKGWKTKTLDEVCSKISDGTHHSPPNTPSGEYKYITAKNIKPWGLDLTDLTFVSKDIHQEIYSRCNPKKGDVLYIKDGATTGIAIVNPLEEEFSLLSSVALLKPIPTEITSRYLCYAMNSPRMYAFVRERMDGAAITRITLKKIKAFPVSYPAINEQNAIVSRLDDLNERCNALHENYQKTLTLCDDLKQSLLRKAFNGEL